MPGYWTDTISLPDTLIASSPAAPISILPGRMPKMPSYVVEESYGSVKVFWLNQEALIKEISHLANRLGERDENISKIILFGSLAERRAVPGSDADILVLLKKEKRPFLDRLSQYHQEFCLGFPVEVFPYTEAELTPIMPQALKNGLILFQR